MIYDKQPLTFDEQVACLSFRGLNINDHNKALHTLERISSFHLSAYCYPVKIIKAPRCKLWLYLI